MDCEEQEEVAAGSELYVDGDMEIFVKTMTGKIMTFEVDGSVKVSDVVVAIKEATGTPIHQIRLVFGGRLMELEKTLAESGVEDRSLLSFILRIRGGGSGEIECPKIRSWRRIMMINQSSIIWEKKYDITLCKLMVEHTLNGGRNGQDFKENVWDDIMAKFSEEAKVSCVINDLEQRLKFYKMEYQIVSNLRKHPKFSWDDRNHSVVATDAEWNKYIMENRGANKYRNRQIPYFNQLEIICSSR